MAKKGGKRSGGGGGGKQRKYTRDNNGRFASTGTGATARGGRLKTASGNKRKTQTTKAAAAKLSGTIAGKVKRNPGAAGKIGQAKAAAKPAPKVDVNSFNAMKRRYDRTKFENSGLTFNTSDRPKGTKQLVAGINRKRAFGIYRAQAARPLNELTQQVARAPFGKFSTVKNPAPAKAFSSQAPGRTKAAEAKAREYRKAAKSRKSPKAAKPAAPKAAKPANKTTRAAKIPKTGQEVMKNEVRKVQNKILRNLNAEIKSAGPNATNLRVEKLALKTKMIDTQPRQTAKQAAKSAKQDVVIRGRIAEMRKQNARVARAQANVAKNADVRNSATSMSKASFARKPSKKTLKSQLRADAALAFYANPAKALKSVNKRKPGFRLPRAMR